MNPSERNPSALFQSSLEVFQTELLYNRHKEYVLALFRQRYVFGGDYLQSLCDRFPELSDDLTDVTVT